MSALRWVPSLSGIQRLQIWTNLALSPVQITKSTSFAHACSSHAKVLSTKDGGVSHSL